MTRVKALFGALLASGLVLSPSAGAQTPQAPPLGVLANLELRDIGGASGGLDISPDQMFAALVERETRLASDDYAHEVIVVELATRQARRLTSAGGFIDHRTSLGRRQGAAALRRAVWSPDGQRIAFLFGEGEHVFLDVVDVATGQTRRVIDGPGDVQRFAWIAGGALVAELSTPRATLDADAARFFHDGFLVESRLEPLMGLFPEPDLSIGRTFVVVDPARGDRRDATSEEVAQLSGRQSSAPTAAAFRESTTSSGARATIGPIDPSQRGGQPELGVFYDNGDQPPQRCAHVECSGEVSGPWLNGDAVLFQRIEAPTRTQTSIYAWTPATNDLTRLRAAEDLLIDCRLAGAALICFRESTAEPRRVVAIDIESGGMRAVYEPNPHWPAFELGRIERLDVSDIFGNPAFGHLVYPANYSRHRRYPMIIVQYRSRGFLRAGVGGEIPIHALSQRGYFVLSVERPQHVADRTRQSNAAALTEEELGDLERRSKLSALDALIELALRRANIDSHRIGITGLSDGAETAFWALQQSDRFAAAVISSPPLDPMSYSLVSEDFTNRARELRGRAGPWPDSPEPWATHWREKPAVNHVDDIDAPILLQLADREALPAFPFYRRMRERGRAVEMFVYPDAYHVKDRPRQVLAAQLRALAWLDFWLRESELADPTDPERFERWGVWRSARTAAPPS